ncbi:dienelactone hydrolase family protein [Actinokineospora pegani]|uniref:dienelactone hydrolase family protein n=1 Tax=Actinokineospora pegani TaxID=2654637 RepID=UPI0012EADC95|nr:alpha/beta hydrolase [Actinokineospora pegani]
MQRRIFAKAGIAAAAVVVATATAVGPQAFAGESPGAAVVAFAGHAKGPAPTEQSVRAQQGPFTTDKLVVPAQAGRGFNKGTIYYPDDTSQGTFGAVAVIPGFLEGESAISWLGPTLASHGFITLTLAPNATTDYPEPRSNQLLAAVDWLANQSPVKDRVDPNRLAVAGHSMGGGGTLIAASKNPALKAAVPLTPWNPHSNFSDVTVPTLIIGADRDFIAPTFMHASPMYNSLKAKQDQAYLKLKNADHFATNRYNATATAYTVSWLKRYVDEDTRYSQFLCPVKSGFQLTCPI